MPKLPVVSARQVIRVLKQMGFDYAPKRGKGSHLAFIKHDSSKTRLVIVPDRNVIPKGTMLAILDQAGISKDDFLKLLSE